MFDAEDQLSICSASSAITFPYAGLAKTFVYTMYTMNTQYNRNALTPFYCIGLLLNSSSNNTYIHHFRRLHIRRLGSLWFTIDRWRKNCSGYNKNSFEQQCPRCCLCRINKRSTMVASTDDEESEKIRQTHTRRIASNCRTFVIIKTLRQFSAFTRNHHTRIKYVLRHNKRVVTAATAI